MLTKLSSRHVYAVFMLLFFFVGAEAQTAKELAKLGDKARDENKPEEAMKYYQQGLQLREREQLDLKTEIHLLGNLYYIYLNANDLDRALPLMLEVEPLALKLYGNEDDKYAGTCQNLGMVYYKKQDYANGLEYFQRSVPGTLKKHGTKSEQMLNLRYQIGALASKAENDAALLEVDLAILANHTLPKKDEAFLIGEIGMIYYGRQEYDVAETYLQRRLDIEEALYTRKHEQFLITMNQLGGTYFDGGQVGKAEKCFREVIDTGKEILDPNHQLMARVYNNLGNVYSSLDKFQSALNSYKGSLAIKETLYGKEDPNYLLTLGNIANMHTAMGNPEEGLKTQQAIYEIRKKISRPDDFQLMVTQMNMAKSLMDLNRKPEAEKIYLDILALHPMQFGALSSLAKTYQSQNKMKEAEKYHLLSLESARKNPAENKYSEVVWNLAYFYRKKGDKPNSVKYYSEGIDLTLDELRNTFAYQTEQGKLWYLRKQMEDEEEFVSYALSEYSKGNPQLLSKAYEFNLAIKGIVLNTVADTRQWVLEKGTEEQKQLYKNWVRLNNYMASMSLHIIHETGVSIGGLNSMQKMANRLERNFTFAAAEHASTLPKKSWREVVAALKPGEAAVEMIRAFDVDGDRPALYAALILTSSMKDHPEAVLLPGAAELENKHFRFYQNSIKIKQEDLVSFEKFWAPVHKKLTALGIKKVYFAPTAVYNQVNLNTLLLPTKSYLINTMEIVNVTSSYDVLVPEKKSASRQSALLVGHPTYLTKKEQPEDQEKHRNFFDELPGTETEIKTISALMQKNKWKVNSYLGAAAEEDVIKGAESPSVLHIATHGFFVGDSYVEKMKKMASTDETHEALLGSGQAVIQNDQMMRSGLILSGASDFLNKDPEAFRSIGKQDGHLTAFEVAMLNLKDTDLVVLSACNTGLGDLDASEGVYGLQRAFRLAGAKNIIMSLWPVSDEATEQLMITFYTEWLATRNLQQSFLHAQQSLMKKYPEPVYWGAFVLLGK